MSGSVNKWIGVGNLGRDPEVRTTSNGSKVVSLSVATDEKWSNGEVKTEWHRITILNERLGEVAERYLKKGSKVYIEGSLATRAWTAPDGQERSATEIVLSKFKGELTMLDGPRDGAAADAGKSKDRQKATDAGRPFDDKIPF